MKVTFLIPTLNEVDWIEASISAARASTAAAGHEPEIIVCDGGSSDGTREVARRSDVALLRGPKGRAKQVNQGAAQSTGDILVMLHADVLIVPETLKSMIQAVENGYVGGFFEIDILAHDSPNLLNVIAWGINLRTRRFETATADQAIFATRDAWVASGGVPELPLMEGNAFIRELRKIGEVAVLPPSIRISGRRWEREGVLKMWLKAYAIRAAYMSGVDVEELADFWDDD